MIRIREYQPSDLAQFTALMSELGYPAMIEEMEIRMKVMQANPNSFTFIALVDENVVGMVGLVLHDTYTHNNKKAQINSLVTKKEYQGQGIGKALVRHVEEYAKNYGADFLYLLSGIRDERMDAHEFYKHIGFDITGYRFVKRLGEEV